MLNNILTAITKKTGIDTSYLLGSGAWVFGSYILSAFVGLVSVLILANVVSPETFGEYQFFLALLPFLSLTALPGINTLVTREVAQGKRVDCAAVTYRQTLYALLASAVLLIFSVWFFFQGNQSFAIGFIILAIFTPFVFSSENAVAYLRGKQDFRRVAIHDFLVKLATTAGVSLFAFVYPHPLVFLFLFLAIKFINRSVLYFIVVKKNKTDEGELVSLTALVDEAKTLSFIGIILNLSHNIDRLLVWVVLGSVGLATYAVVLSVPQQIAAVFGLLVHSILVPRIANRDVTTRSYKQEFLKKTFLFLWVYIALSIAYTVFAVLFFETLFSQYKDALWLSVYALVVLLLPLITSILWQLFLVSKDHKILMISGVLGWVGLGVGWNIIQPHDLFEVMTLLIIKEALTVGYLLWATRFK